ncbi:MAG TPA: acetyl-CoA carboxylase biotin carboxyl carrier protein [Alkalispirochaeta sp.]|nr:acetyl-CoA carboxylase biotin carboxyl carrier protein [Alkalispirochaeta sp.]
MNLDEIITLINTFNESSLTELKLDQDGTQLTLTRKTESNPVYTQPMMVHPHQMPAGTPIMTDPSMAGGGGAQPAPTGAPAAGDAAHPRSADSDSAADTSGLEVITSPIVGTVYRAPSPDSPPFCQDGDIVEKGKPLCILEAMKVMNELEAEFSMEIVSFKVNSGDMVEYGTPLVEVRRV